MDQIYDLNNLESDRRFLKILRNRQQNYSEKQNNYFFFLCNSCLPFGTALFHYEKNDKQIMYIDLDFYSFSLPVFYEELLINKENSLTEEERIDVDEDFFQLLIDNYRYFPEELQCIRNLSEKRRDLGGKKFYTKPPKTAIGTVYKSGCCKRRSGVILVVRKDNISEFQNLIGTVFKDPSQLNKIDFENFQKKARKKSIYFDKNKEKEQKLQNFQKQVFREEHFKNNNDADILIDARCLKWEGDEKIDSTCKAFVFNEEKKDLKIVIDCSNCSEIRKGYHPTRKLFFVMGKIAWKPQRGPLFDFMRLTHEEPSESIGFKEGLFKFYINLPLNFSPKPEISLYKNYLYLITFKNIGLFDNLEENPGDGFNVPTENEMDIDD